jgi:hypothetical protein
MCPRPHVVRQRIGKTFPRQRRIVGGARVVHRLWSALYQGRKRFVLPRTCCFIPLWKRDSGFAVRSCFVRGWGQHCSRASCSPNASPGVAAVEAAQWHAWHGWLACVGDRLVFRTEHRFESESRLFSWSSSVRPYGHRHFPFEPCPIRHSPLDAVRRLIEIASVAWHVHSGSNEGGAWSKGGLMKTASGTEMVRALSVCYGAGVCRQQ